MKFLSLIFISAFLVSAGALHGQIQTAAPEVPPDSSLPDLHTIKITRSGSQKVTEGEVAGAARAAPYESSHFGDNAINLVGLGAEPPNHSRFAVLLWVARRRSVW